MSSHARYRAGMCTACGQQPHSAARPRCTPCHHDYQARLYSPPGGAGKTVLTAQPESLGAHALAYAAVGLPVLPLHPRRKEPATKHGKDAATTDPDQIRAWWSRHPEHNIGVRPLPGIVVIDVDPRNGGDKALTELLAGRDLPATWTCRTGSDGLHIWLRHPGPNRSKLCTGVDLKDHRGYLVMPPSVHPNGQRYRWEVNAPISHAPAWLVSLLTPPPASPPTSRTGGSGARSDGLVRFVSDAPEGNRNHALFWAANRAAEAGTLPAMSAELVAAAISAGLTETAARATIRSAEKRSM